MASLIPLSVKQAIVAKWVDSSEVWYLMLMKASFGPSATHVNLSDVVPATNEITDDKAVYPAGGVPITGRVATVSGNNCYLAATNVQIGPGADLSFNYGVIYTKSTGSNAASWQIRAEIDFGGAQVVTNGTSIIQWNALGIILVS